MPMFPPRRVTAIDAELRALSEVISGALGELTAVRRRQAELVDMEAALVVAVDVRMRRMDDLLDQRLQAVLADGRPTSGAAVGTAEPGLRSADGSDDLRVSAHGPVSTNL